MYRTGLFTILDQFVISDTRQIIYEYTQYQILNEYDRTRTMVDLLNYVENRSEYKSDKLFLSSQISPRSILSDFRDIFNEFKIGILANSEIKGYVQTYILMEYNDDLDKSIFDLEKLIKIILEKMEICLDIYDVKDEIVIKYTADFMEEDNPDPYYGLVNTQIRKLKNIDLWDFKRIQNKFLIFYEKMKNKA